MPPLPSQHDAIQRQQVDRLSGRATRNPILGQCTGYKELGALLARLTGNMRLRLLRTHRKLGLSFFAYLEDGLALLTGQPKVPPLAELIIRASLWLAAPNLLRLP